MTSRHDRAATAGLAGAVLLIAAAIAVPALTGWQVWARSEAAPAAPPLHGFWQPHVGSGTLPALVIAVLGVWCGPRLVARLGWAPLLVAGYGLGLGWLLALAFVDGPAGISRVLGSPDEYLTTARTVQSWHDVHHLLGTYIARIPFSAGAQHWPIHVAGHPPGMLLFFVALVHLGLGGDFAAGAVVTVIAASVAPAVMVTMRALGHEDVARSAAPYLVLTPAAVYLAVSADAVMAAAVAWGLAFLALAARRRLARGWGWAVLSGLLLGSAVMMSYGLPLAGLLALAVLLAARRWWPLPVAAASAIAVLLVFAVYGFAWWHAYPVLQRRYWDGLAAKRPAAYWLWGDLAALLISAGPAVGAGIACVGSGLRDQWRKGGRLVSLTGDPVVMLVGAATLCVVLADVSRMSKAEVERIWLPFAPWLTLALTRIPPRWRTPLLVVQLVTALLVEHLLYTTW